MAVVGGAEDLLHLLDRRVQLLLEGRLEAVGEHLHRVAQPLADDAHLMQVGVIVQVAAGGGVQLVEQFAEGRPGQVDQRRAAPSSCGRWTAPTVSATRRSEAKG